MQQQLIRVVTGLISRGQWLIWIVALSIAPWAAPAAAAEKVQVTDPYIELRTGPGRGYPIFYVAERNEWIEIELRHTDWFKVRTAAGKEGWVTREQLETTLTQVGGKTTFGRVALEDYFRRRFELGAAYGLFQSEPMLKVWTTYNFADTLALEATVGQVQGVFSGTNLWHLNLLMQPWSDWRLSPFFGIGVGKLNNFPNASLIGSTTSNSKLANATIGFKLHVSERFIARLDYTQYLAYIADNRTDQYRAITAGLGFFF